MYKLYQIAVHRETSFNMKVTGTDSLVLDFLSTAPLSLAPYKVILPPSRFAGSNSLVSADFQGEEFGRLLSNQGKQLDRDTRAVNTYRAILSHTT